MAEIPFTPTVALLKRTVPAPLGRVAQALGVGAKRTVAIAAFLLLWEVAPRVGLVDRTFLVPFSEAVKALIALAEDGQLWDNTRASLVRSLAGFLIAIGVGVPLGLLIGWYRPVSEILGPLLELFRNTAALALLPVFILLLGIGETSKIAIIFYMTVFLVLLNTMTGVAAIPRNQLRGAENYGVSAWQLFAWIVFPATLSYSVAGARIAMGNSFAAVVGAELIAANAGLGYRIVDSGQWMAMDQMFATMLVLGLLGIAADRLARALSARFLRHYVHVNDAH